MAYPSDQQSSQSQVQPQSYIDYHAITSPTFSPTAYANKLVLATNNPSDTPLDLSTPLSRVLFDVQEVDTHIDALTTQHALPLISYTQQRAEASTRILEQVEAQVHDLRESYQRLEREVLQRYEAAERTRLAAERMVSTLRLGRSVQRVVQMGRQLEVQTEEVLALNHRAMVPAANTLLGLRQLLAATGKGAEGEGLGKVNVVGTLRTDVVAPRERTLLAKAQQVVREFSMSSLLVTSGGGGQSGQTFAQTEDTKSRATSALQTLYLLSPIKATTTLGSFEPTLLISALQLYLQNALTSSVAALSRALATLPTLDRTLLEISARCQNIVALETLLSGTPPPPHPLLPAPSAFALHSSAAERDDDDDAPNFLRPLLRHLDTSSLPSYFWRSMAGQLSSRVQDILSRGGVSARTLRSNREYVRDAIRECVDRGSRLPVSGLAPGRKEGKVANWGQEAAVMVGSVVGPLQR